MNAHKSFVKKLPKPNYVACWETIVFSKTLNKNLRNTFAWQERNRNEGFQVYQKSKVCVNEEFKSVQKLLSTLCKNFCQWCWTNFCQECGEILFNDVTQIPANNSARIFVTDVSKTSAKEKFTSMQKHLPIVSRKRLSMMVALDSNRLASVESAWKRNLKVFRTI